MKPKIMRMGGWYFYLSGLEKKLDSNKCGKWFCFFSDQVFAQAICQKAIEEDICYECKCSDLEIRGFSGIICFYLNGDDIENHYRVIDFMIQNDLIRKTKAGRYYNISFKFDTQTRDGEYGADFNGKIKLNEFIDLNTGEHIMKDSK